MGGVGWLVFSYLRCHVRWQSFGSFYVSVFGFVVKVDRVLLLRFHFLSANVSVQYRGIIVEGLLLYWFMVRRVMEFKNRGLHMSRILTIIKNEFSARCKVQSLSCAEVLQSMV